jgi:hypothetical protein
MHATVEEERKQFIGTIQHGNGIAANQEEKLKK